MKPSASTCLPLALALSVASFAAHALAPDAPPQKGNNPKFDAALEQCRQSSGSSGRQRSDPAQMESCLTAKGFPKPGNAPQGQQRRPTGAAPTTQDSGT